jgi:hypothetical protein
MTKSAPVERASGPAIPHARTRRWLLFVHQLPTHPSNLRVSTWRRLQQLGALPLKQAIYVLPDTPGAREDFEWLKTEVTSAGGDAVVFAANNVDAWSEDALVNEFRQSRQSAYAELARDAENALKRAGRTRQPRGTRAPAVRRLLDIFTQRLSAIERVDFFGSAGRDRVIELLKQLEDRSARSTPRRPGSGAGKATDLKSVQARLWVTRPRPGVDRMASAWLIRRFIDPRARFGFASDKSSVPDQGIPFDMFGVEFSHQNDGCTFETLCTVFGIDEPAVSRLAAIVHDLDLKDGRFGAAEVPTVGALIDGLQLAHQDDHALLEQGITLFDSLHRAFAQTMRSGGPRPLATPRRRRAKGSRHRGKRP